MRFLCWVGLHKRSGSKARFDGHTFVSVCRHCDRPMVKGDDDRWQVVRNASLDI